MVPLERLKPSAPISQIKHSQLFGHCIATWYAMSQSQLKLTEIGTSYGRG